MKNKTVRQLDEKVLKHFIALFFLFSCAMLFRHVNDSVWSRKTHEQVKVHAWVGAEKNGEKRNKKNDGNHWVHAPEGSWLSNWYYKEKWATINAMASLYWFVRPFVCLGSHSCHHRHYICVFVSKTIRNENCVHFVFIRRLATFHRFMHCTTSTGVRNGTNNQTATWKMPTT